MATRYWHWLLAQQQKKKENYEVKGTADMSSIVIEFDPYRDYNDIMYESITINTQQNGNS